MTDHRPPETIARINVGRAEYGLPPRDGPLTDGEIALMSRINAGRFSRAVERGDLRAQRVRLDGVEGGRALGRLQLMQLQEQLRRASVVFRRCRHFDSSRFSQARATVQSPSTVRFEVPRTVAT